MLLRAIATTDDFSVNGNGNTKKGMAEAFKGHLWPMDLLFQRRTSS